METHSKAQFGKLVDFDFNLFKLPAFVTHFKPLIFRDGDRYYATLSPKAENAILGTGNAPEDALVDWNEKLRASLIASGLSAEQIRNFKSVKAISIGKKIS